MDPVRISAVERFYRHNGVKLSKLDLTTYNLYQTLERFGLDLGDLTREQLSIVLAAKALRPILAGLQIDYSDRHAPGPAAALSTQLPPDRSRADVEGTSPPNDPGCDIDEDYGPLEGLHQISRSLPSELAYLNIEKLEFIRRVVTGELQGIVESPGPTTSRESPPESPDSPSAAAESDLSSELRPLVAHVLLDVSESMGKRDRRGVVARGSALAFLLMSFEREASLQLTPFASTPGESSTGTGVSGLHTLTTRILTLPNSGSTNIQATLTKIAAEALPSQRTDLLLITDGLSTLRSNPLGRAHLHTIRIVVAEGEMNDRLRRDLDENMTILRQWSDTLIEMDLKAILHLIRPGVEDLLPFAHRLNEFSTRFDEVVSERQFQALAREIDNLEYLSSQLDAAGPLEGQSLPAQRDYQHLRELLAKCRARLGTVDVHTLIHDNESRLGSETAKRIRALDELGRPELESVAIGPSGEPGDFRLTMKTRPGGAAANVDWRLLWTAFVKRLTAIAARFRKS